MREAREYVRHIKAEISFLTAAQGGRQTPIPRHYAPDFHYGGASWDARYRFVGKILVSPGDDVLAYVCFLSPERHAGRLALETPFELREGSQVVATGRVIAILELVARPSPA